MSSFIQICVGLNKTSNFLSLNEGKFVFMFPVSSNSLLSVLNIFILFLQFVFRKKKKKYNGCISSASVTT